MSLEKIKIIVKSSPILYKILRPIATLIRQVKDAPSNASMQAFRKYLTSLPQHVSEPIFVKVGANDGITGDPCSDILLANSQWKGLLIEPVPYSFDRLRNNFHDSNRFSFEQVAIGSTSGKKPFYYVDRTAGDAIPNLPSWFDQLGSFDKNHIIRALDGILEPFIIESTIEVSTLSDVLNKHGIGTFHLLQIDTEGYDYEVLKSLDLAMHEPLVIFVEHMNVPKQQKKEMFHLLHEHGYHVRDCGGDYFALHEKANKACT